MRRYARFMLIALGLGTGAAADDGPAPGPNCDRAYRDMRDTIARQAPHLSAAAAVDLERIAVRIYDACMTGDLQRPRELFDKLARNRS